MLFPVSITFNGERVPAVIAPHIGLCKAILRNYRVIEVNDHSLSSREPCEENVSVSAGDLVQIVGGTTGEVLAYDGTDALVKLDSEGVAKVSLTRLAFRVPGSFETLENTLKTVKVHMVENSVGHVFLAAVDDASGEEANGLTSLMPLSLPVVSRPVMVDAEVDAVVDSDVHAEVTATADAAVQAYHGDKNAVHLYMSKNRMLYEFFGRKIENETTKFHCTSFRMFGADKLLLELMCDIDIEEDSFKKMFVAVTRVGCRMRKYTLPSGKLQADGFVVDFKMNGLGILYDGKGNVVFQGIFKDNKPVKRITGQIHVPTSMPNKSSTAAAAATAAAKAHAPTPKGSAPTPTPLPPPPTPKALSGATVASKEPEDAWQLRVLEFLSKQCLNTLATTKRMDKQEVPDGHLAVVDYEQLIGRLKCKPRFESVTDRDLGRFLKKVVSIANHVSGKNKHFRELSPRTFSLNADGLEALRSVARDYSPQDVRSVTFCGTPKLVPDFTCGHGCALTRNHKGPCSAILGKRTRHGTSSSGYVESPIAASKKAKVTQQGNTATLPEVGTACDDREEVLIALDAVEVVPCIHHKDKDVAFSGLKKASLTWPCTSMQVKESAGGGFVDVFNANQCIVVQVKDPEVALVVAKCLERDDTILRNCVYAWWNVMMNDEEACARWIKEGMWVKPSM